MQTEQKHKCNPKTLICLDNGKPCPYGGVRDFRKLQEREVRRLGLAYERGVVASIEVPRKPYGGRGRPRK